MTYKNFLQITLGLQKAGRDATELYKMNVDLYDYVDPYHTIINVALSEIYTKKGIEWLQWFMYENDFGQTDWSKISSISSTYKDVDGKMEKVERIEGKHGYGATDDNGEPICFSFESTYNFLKQYEKRSKSKNK